MLLVDHRQSQARKAGSFLDQCVGADSQVDPAGGDALPHRRATVTGDVLAGGHQGQGEMRPQQPRQGSEVLFREQLRGRHQGRLQAAPRRDQASQGGNHRLAATDIPLHQAQHRPRAGQVSDDFLEHAFLGPGQLERQQTPRLAPHRIADPVAVRLPLPPAAPANGGEL